MSWLRRLAEWAGDPVAETLDLGKGEERLTRTCMQEVLAPGAGVTVPGWAVPSRPCARATVTAPTRSGRVP